MYFLNNKLILNVKVGQEFANFNLASSLNTGPWLPPGTPRALILTWRSQGFLDSAEEAIPDNPALGIKTAVAKNFEELVTKSEKDILVKIFIVFLRT